ncbi:MAG: T9SS type A sorting domain-containing protein, partial [Bacteroidota bacterium]
MQSRTITFSQISKSIITNKILLCAFFLMSLMAVQNRASAQAIIVNVEDLLMLTEPTAQQESQVDAFSISQNPELDIQLSPNPVSNYLKIQKPSTVNIKRLDVIDMQGNLIYSGAPQSNTSTSIPMGSGLYNF